MVPSLTSTPSGLAHCVYVLDSVMCKIVHNPLVSSTVVGGIVLSVAAKQYNTWSPYNLAEESGFLPDFFQNVINLIFLMRFPLALKTGLVIRSNKYAETLLFACLNIVAVVSLCSPYPFSSLMGLVFRVLLWVLIICPYVILALNLGEYAFCRFNESFDKEKANEKEKEKEKLGKLEKPLGLLPLIVDANNSFLAIFIAQSFTAINLDLPFSGSSLLPVVYRYASYSLKFYLIYCFVLYEIVVVIYEISDIKSYRELYQPVHLGVKRRTSADWFDAATPVFLFATTCAAMAFDAVMMWLEFSYQEL